MHLGPAILHVFVFHEIAVEVVGELSRNKKYASSSGSSYSSANLLEASLLAASVCVGGFSVRRILAERPASLFGDRSDDVGGGYPQFFRALNSIPR